MYAVALCDKKVNSGMFRFPFLFFRKRTYKKTLSGVQSLVGTFTFQLTQLHFLKNLPKIDLCVEGSRLIKDVGRNEERTESMIKLFWFLVLVKYLNVVRIDSV